jgi:DNA methylase
MVKEALNSQQYKAAIGTYFKVSEIQAQGLTMDYNLEGMVIGHFGNLDQCFHFDSNESRSMMFPFRATRLNPTNRETGKSLNPTTKPVSLMRFLLRKFTLEKTLVLDALAGLGSLAEACFLDKRSVVVVEADPEQRKFIQSRLKSKVASLLLGNEDKELVKASDNSEGWERENLIWVNNVFQHRKNVRPTSDADQATNPATEHDALEAPISDDP